jgi:hypothetical protein
MEDIPFLQLVEERCDIFQARYALRPDAVICHPHEPDAVYAVRKLGLSVLWDVFCPLGECFPIHRASFEEAGRRRLLRQLSEGIAELEMWKARQKP